MAVSPAATRLKVTVATCSALPFLLDAGSDESSCTCVEGEPIVGVTVYGHPPPLVADTASTTAASKLILIWNPVSFWLFVLMRTTMSKVDPTAALPASTASVNAPAASRRLVP